MASVEDRVVRMVFDNASFEAKLHTTIASLGSLDKALKMDGAKKGLQAVSVEAGKSNKALRMDGAKQSLQSISAEASKFNMGNIGASVEGASAKFTALATIGITALSNITSKAISAGAQIAKSLTVAPLKAGFEEYELNMNSIQTVLANTRDKGTNLQDVNSALDTLNQYADKTIYNFGQMTKNIGTFTSAGVDLDTSVASIKGISNIAAISGSNADQASSAMYQLSQAVASGSVKLQDWNSVVNSGMGGEVFQKSLFETGKALGTLKDVPMEQTFKEWTDSGHSFRESLKDGWITSDVLTTTLQGFTGEMDVAQLKAKGFTDAQAQSIIEMGKTGLEAATKIRTFSQLMGTMKESIGSGWSESFRNIFGDFNQATELFSLTGSAFGKMISYGADARNALLKGWNVFGGRQAMVEALIHTFNDLRQIINPIRLAFRSMFPRTTSLELINLTKRFRDFMASLRPSQETMKNIFRVFRGFFAILKIGWAVIKGTVGFIKTLIGSLVGLGNGNILKFAANIGDLFTNLEKFLVEGDGIANFFDTLGAIFTGAIGGVKAFAAGIVDLIAGLNIGIPQGVLDFFDSFKEKAAGLFDGLSPARLGGIVTFFASLQHTIANFFSSFNGDNISAVGNSVTEAAGKVTIFGRVFERLSAIWDGFKTATKAVALAIGAVAKVIYEAFTGIGTAIGNAFSGGNFSGAFDLLNAALIGGVILTIKKFSDTIKDFDWTGGLFDSLKKVVEGLTDQLKAMQLKIKSEAIMNIAKAIALLAVSAIALSMVDSASLAKGFTAMTVGFGQLVGTLKALDKFKGATGAKDFIALSVGMNVLALSMLSMSFAVARLGSMENDELARGLTGVTVLLGVVTGASVLLSKHTSGLLSSSLAIRTMAVALGVLAGVVKLFAMMKTDEIFKGLSAIAASLGILVLAVNLVPKDVGKTGVQILIISFALTVLAGAVKLFALLSFEEIAKGLLGIFGSLGLVVLALNLMPPDMEGKAAGLLLIAGALAIMAIAMRIIGGMDIGDMAAAIIGIALALVVLTVGMNAMENAIPGALALLVAAAGLRVLAEVIKIFAKIGWKDMLMGLGMLALALTVLGVAGYLLEPAVPGLLGFATALLVLGAAIALIGVGVLMFAKSFVLLSTTGEKGSKNFIRAMKTIGKAIPSILSGVAEGILEMVNIFVKAAPKLVDKFIEILGMILDGITTLIPKAGELISTLIHTLLGIIREAVPEYLLLGMDIIMAFLDGIRDRIGDIVDIVADIITNFINALSDNMQQIIDAGVDLMVKFLDGVGQNMEEITAAVGRLIVAFIGAVFSFHQQIIDAGVDMIVKFLEGVGQNVHDIVNAVTELVMLFINEIGGSSIDIMRAGTQMLTDFIDAAAEEAKNIVRAATQAIVSFIGEIDNSVMDIINAATRMMVHFIQGIGMAAGLVVIAALNTLATFLNTLATKVVQFVDTCFVIVTNFLNAMAEVIRRRDDELRGAGANLAKAVIQGILDGLKPGSVVGWTATEIAQRLAGPLGKGIELAKKVDVLNIIGDPYSLRSMRYLGEPVINGITRAFDMDTTMESSLVDLVDRSMDTFSDSVTRITEALGEVTEFQPTISPVLDLTQVKSEAAKIGEYIETMPTLNPGVSYARAKDIAYGVNGQAGQTAENAPGVPGSVQFNQTINAPEQLSVSDIYKQTRNQITMAKEELRIP